MGDGQDTISRLARGGLWVGILNFGGRFLGVARILVLARLLTPSDFGIAGLAVLLMAITFQATQPGFHEALVQSDSDPDSHSLDTTFVLRSGVSILAAALLFVSAPFLSALFNEPDALLPIRVVSLVILLRGFRNPGILFFERELSFRPYAVYNGLGELMNLLVAVGVALLIGNYWAIVAGVTGAEVIRTTLSYVLHPYRPSVRLDVTALGEMFDYGKWIQSSRILALVVTRIDDAFVARFFGSEALGLYQVSFTLSQLPVSELSETVATVAFPAFSKLDDPRRLADQFTRAAGLTVVLSFPLAAGLGVVARPVVVIFLGNDWLQAVPILQILIMYGAVRSLNNILGSLAKAVGRPDLNVKTMIIKLVGTVGLLFPLSEAYGVVGVGVATTLPLLASVPYHLYYLNDELAEGFLTELFRRLTPALVATILMIGALYVFGEILFSSRGTFGVSESVVWLVTAASFGALVYTGTAVFVDELLETGIRRDVRRLLGSL